MMEKYSQDDDTLLLGLRDEEAQLMVKMGQFMSMGEKTASEQHQMGSVESRLGQVRAKITELDTKKPKE